MAQWNQFVTPAGQIDFPESPQQQQALVNQWTLNLTGFTNQGVTGNPWQATNSSNQNWYFNPVTTNLEGGGYAPIQWSAFPGRIGYYNQLCGWGLNMGQQLSLADTGYSDPQGQQSFPAITKNPCTGQSISPSLTYGPYGPRGWQDEYCEWSVQRDPTTNKILRIDFTCENPEYWNTLWMTDPNKVLSLYQSTLGKPQIQLEDLYLTDGNSQPVIDPSTGRPAYNPLNKWNNGPVSTDAAGGAMHLTSTPNTLQTEIGLASAASVPRQIGNTDPGKLICCAQYGQPGRNSDPHIGQQVNVLVAPQGSTPAPVMVTLANPPGLYIQLPDFSGYQTPDNTDASTFWTIVRGSSTLTDPNGTQLPGNYILHASFQVPQDKGYTVSDITINGVAILWAGQVAQTFQMQITGMGIPPTLPVQTPLACVGTPSSPVPQPLQLFHAAVFRAMINTTYQTVVGAVATLASNSTLIAPLVAVGQQNVPMLLTVAMDAGPLPTVSFGDGITVQVLEMNSVNYAVPGNSYPSQSTALQLLVSVAASATQGLRGVTVTMAGQQGAIAMPDLLNVVGA